ncbi:homoserine kinase [Heliomicrobium modesticaldum Ice1]|uniref:Homoserine kinase n=1 Tax=Heliobacterium modesticaldum (strain ATCC 51547 / Ice1) TaxID=498761 RepID=B0TFR6_HELMI|nr:homoserine kinase [Heliomicrobium modesticaldum]ABZ84496.1 homoserine kinase [Heliomicrobium modesticaldum Ice1]
MRETASPTVRVIVPATTANLGPGFDTLGMALDLYNHVELTETGEGFVVDVEGEGAASIPRNESNIVLRVVRQVYELAGRKPAGLRLRLRNEIPVARGLGSSAAALVGGAVAANELCGNCLSDQEILEIVTSFEGHPDNVAPALFGGVVVSAMIAEGDRTEVVSRKIPPPYGMRAIVAIPDFPLATKRARNALPAVVPFKDAVFNVSRTSMVILAFIHNDWDLLAKVMEDRLHQPYREPLIPGMGDVFSAAREAGALAAVLSGAGPTLIAFARENTAEVAQAMEETFARHGVSCVTKELKPCAVGAKVI